MFGGFYWPEKVIWPSPIPIAQRQTILFQRQAVNKYFRHIIQSIPSQQTYSSSNSLLKAHYWLFPFQFSLTLLIFFSRIYLYHTYKHLCVMYYLAIVLNNFIFCRTCLFHSVASFLKARTMLQCVPCTYTQLTELRVVYCRGSTSLKDSLLIGFKNNSSYASADFNQSKYKQVPAPCKSLETGYL